MLASVNDVFNACLVQGDMTGDILLAVAAFFTVVSGLVYLRQNWDVIREGA